MTEDKESGFDNFHGCYLLTNGRRTYVGYTVNPLRRIQQHNLGREKGGAKKTENKGPWTMVLIVHGFMSNMAALQFEWAWQHPQLSKRVRDKVVCLDQNGSRKQTLDYQLRVLAVLLASEPWKVLPLCVRWVTPSMRKASLEKEKEIPGHIVFKEGPFEDPKHFKRSATQSKQKREMILTLNSCVFCDSSLCDENENFAFCPVSSENGALSISTCQMQAHLTCWAEDSLSRAGSTTLVPITCHCPKCKRSFLWGDVITYKLKVESSVTKKLLIEQKTKNMQSKLDDSLGDLLKLLDES